MIYIYIVYMNILEKISLLGNTEYINCFLVTKNVREGYLFQPIDNMETDMNSPISKKKLKLMKKFFPQLLQTPTTQGVLISLKKFSQENIEDDAFLGKILGFPCESLKEIKKKMNDNQNLVSKTVSINVLMLQNIEGLDIPITRNVNIIAFECLNYNKYKKDVKRLISKIKKVFKEDLDMKEIIKDVELEVKDNYSENHLIHKLSNNKKLNKDEIEELDNYFYNMGFNLDFQDFIKNNIDYNNPIHRGILIGLLTYSKYPQIEPFYPLQNHGEKINNAVTEITNNWGELIIETIKKIPKTHYKKNKKNKKNKKTKKNKKKTNKNKTNKNK